MFQKCDKCGKGIGFNEAYISITYNLQKQTHDLMRQENAIDITHSEIVMVFCGNCGNKHNAREMTNALQLKEIVCQEIPKSNAGPIKQDTKLQNDKTKKRLTLEERMQLMTYPQYMRALIREVYLQGDLTLQEAHDIVNESGMNY